MDITPTDQTTQQAISDDQELAKALAGVMPDDPTVEQPAPQADAVNPAPDSATNPDDATQPDTSQPTVAPTAPTAAPGSDLESIKKDALGELRPLIDRVDLPAEEKFDTYLMLIRSTDDQSLIGPAHTAAQGITDEKRKAEALLDIVKEIDYLSHKDQPIA